MMKRKLALLLAIVMIISALPMTVFAATSENHLTKSSMSVPDYTLFYESGMALVNAGGDPAISGPVSGNPDLIEYWVDGSNLIIELNNDVNDGILGDGVFKVRLENANFFFRDTANHANVTLTGIGTGSSTAGLAAITQYGADVFADDAGALQVKGVTKSTDFTGTDLGDATSTYDTAKGVLNDNIYVRTDDNSGDDVRYLMQISMADATEATVRLLEPGTDAQRIVIPLVVRGTEEEADIHVMITDSATSVSQNNYLLATSRAGRTTTKASGTVTSRSDFELKNIVIRENRIGSVISGAAFELAAPSGYYFDNLDDVEVYVEAGLSWAAGKTGLGVENTDYTIDFRTRNTRTDKSRIEVVLTTIEPSTNIAGTIYVNGLLLVSEDPDYDTVVGKDLSLEIRDISPSGQRRSFTNESFKVATATDYIVTLKRLKDEIPELVSGRLDSYIESTGTVYSPEYVITDEHHLAAEVRIEEAIPNAWWSERTTTLTLPEGVKVLKAKFSDVTNMVTDSSDALTTTDDDDNSFYNTGTRENAVVTVKDNEINISRLRVATTTGANPTNKKARFDLSLWLNIDVEYEGDIDLVLTGSAVTNEDDTPSVTIARAIRPVEVSTKVTDIRIGYQYVSVADFEITETKAGNLLQGETVYVSVTDEISVDMNIAKGFETEITEGNLRISNVILRSALGYAGETIDGQLRFDIDRESSEASTIKFSNVQVKVDNTVPQSNLSITNDRGINLVVWGSAIAKNYEGLIGSISVGGTLNKREFFPTPGIRAKYINVATPAPGGISEFVNVVRVSIGNPVILINDDQYTMPVAAYVSNTSNSTMVPLRFVSLALGLPETAVKWDPETSTCTIDAGNRIVQFQTGNTNYLVNGVSIPMISPDGLPVAMEIREERAFVPFRAIGEAFGIQVSWDQATNTAIYNAPEQF